MTATCPEEDVEVGGVTIACSLNKQMTQVGLCAVADHAQGLQRLSDAVAEFCDAIDMLISIQKTNIIGYSPATA